MTVTIVGSHIVPGVVSLLVHHIHDIQPCRFCDLCEIGAVWVTGGLSPCQQGLDLEAGVAIIVGGHAVLEVIERGEVVVDLSYLLVVAVGCGNVSCYPGSPGLVFFL